MVRQVLLGFSQKPTDNNKNNNLFVNFFVLHKHLNSLNPRHDSLFNLKFIRNKYIKSVYLTIKQKNNNFNYYNYKGLDKHDTRKIKQFKYNESLFSTPR